MPLTHAQVAQFQAHGYAAVPDFFGPRAVQALQAEVERVLAGGAA
jgi:hypothetical protein